MTGKPSSAPIFTNFFMSLTLTLKSNCKLFASEMLEAAGPKAGCVFKASIESVFPFP
jgi:hypothetical protein